MYIFALVLAAVAAFGTLTSTIFMLLTLIGAGSFRRVARKQREVEATLVDAALPGLSLLKPLHGEEPGLDANLATFFEQDYPQYEILFCARTAEDAGLATARQVAQRYPQIPVTFMVTNGQPDYINAKVASMERMETEASYEILVISDSDVRVTPNYLRAVALPFADQRVGGMTCPYRGVAAEGGLWARLEAVGMSVEMTAGVLVARLLEGMQFTLGPTMAFRRDVIRQMGGFRVTADSCADDFVLGNETFQRGHTVVLSHHAIDHMVINSSFVSSMKHQVRWMRSTRFSRPKGHFGTALTFSMPFGLLGLATAIWLGHPGWGLALIAWNVATRLALSIVVGGFIVNDKNWMALLFLYPLRDLMGFFFWVASYLSSCVLWRGKIFQLLPGGKMKAVE